MSEIDAPHTGELEVVNLFFARAVACARNELVHCADGPSLAEVLRVSAVGETCEPRVIEGHFVGETAVVLNVE